MKDKIIELLNKGCLIKREEDSKKRDLTVYHPSALGDCIRKMYYEKKSYEPLSLEPQVLRIFNNGSYAHVRLSEYLRKAGVLVAEELPVRNDVWNVRGNCDAIIELDGEKILLDFKTIKHYPFTKMKEGEKELDKGYLTQMNVYLWLLGYSKGFFVFEDKNTQELLISEVEYDQTIIEGVKEKITLLNEYIKKNETPNREYDKDSDWQCRYCLYRHHCYEGDDKS